MASNSSGDEPAIAGAGGNTSKTIQETIQDSESIISSGRHVPESDEPQQATNDDGHDSALSQDPTASDPSNEIPETLSPGELDSAVPATEPDDGVSNLADSMERELLVAEHGETDQLGDSTVEHQPMSLPAGPSASSPPPATITEDRALPEVPVTFPARTSSRRSPAGESHSAARVRGTPRRRTSAGAGSRGSDSHSGAQEFALPRWQPDGEVTYCPICRTQFSIFVRKHHCRLAIISMHPFAISDTNPMAENVAGWSVTPAHLTES